MKQGDLQTIQQAAGAALAAYSGSLCKGKHDCSAALLNGRKCDSVDFWVSPVYRHCALGGTPSVAQEVRAL